MSKKNIKPTVNATAESFIESLKNDLSGYSSSLKETKKGTKSNKITTKTIVYDEKMFIQLDGEREGVVWKMINLNTASEYINRIKDIASYAYFTDDKTRNLKDDFLKIVGLASMIDEDHIEYFNRILHKQLDRYDEEIEVNYGKEALTRLSAQISDE